MENWESKQENQNAPQFGLLDTRWSSNWICPFSFLSFFVLFCLNFQIEFWNHLQRSLFCGWSAGVWKKRKNFSVEVLLYSLLALRLEVLQDEIWITYLSLFLDLMYNFQMDQEVSDLTGLQPEDLEAIEVLRLSSVNSRLCICHLTDHLTFMWIIINLFSFVSLVSLILIINNKYRHMPIKTKTSKDEW